MKLNPKVLTTSALALLLSAGAGHAAEELPLASASRNIATAPAPAGAVSAPASPAATSATASDAAETSASVAPMPAPPPASGVSLSGEDILNIELQHRLKVAHLSRSLEIETLESKIAAEKKKREMPAEGQAALPVVPLAVPPSTRVPSTRGSQGFLPQEDVERPRPSAPTPPRLLGISGSSAVFAAPSGAGFVVPVGGSIDQYTLQSIEGHAVTLAFRSDSKQKVTLHLP